MNFDKPSFPGAMLHPENHASTDLTTPKHPYDSCRLCHYNAPTRDHLCEHYYLLHRYTVSCYYCAHQFEDFTEMKLHFDRYHTIRRCVFCGDIILSTSTIGHYQKCHELELQLFKCSDCKAIRFSYLSLAYHLLFVHRNGKLLDRRSVEREIDELEAQLARQGERIVKIYDNFRRVTSGERSREENHHRTQIRRSNHVRKTDPPTREHGRSERSHQSHRNKKGIHPSFATYSDNYLSALSSFTFHKRPMKRSGHIGRSKKKVAKILQSFRSLSTSRERSLSPETDSRLIGEKVENALESMSESSSSQSEKRNDLRNPNQPTDRRIKSNNRESEPPRKFTTYKTRTVQTTEAPIRDFSRHLGPSPAVIHSTESRAHNKISTLKTHRCQEPEIPRTYQNNDLELTMPTGMRDKMEHELNDCKSRHTCVVCAFTATYGTVVKHLSEEHGVEVTIADHFVMAERYDAVK